MRVITTREELSLGKLPEEVGEHLGEYQEIVGLGTIRFHACDIVWIPHDGNHLNVRIDFPAT